MDAIRALQLIEQQWDNLLLQIDERLPELAEEEQADPGEYVDAG